ncbi:MAG TPA: hypothetical protein VGM90_31720 [Kofleriaceae bacterium]|jgi:hypothetical protein
MKLAIATVLGMAVLGACAASSAEIKTAKTTQYKLQPKQALDVAMQVAQIDYKVLGTSIDLNTRSFKTEPQWYSKEGDRISPTTDGHRDYVNAHGGDVQVWMVVSVRPVTDSTVFIDVHPKTLQLVGQPSDPSPKPRELAEDDPNLPPWIHGRVDELSVKMYENLKQYAVQGPPGVMPAAGAETAAPPPAPPSEGPPGATAPAEAPHAQ